MKLLFQSNCIDPKPAVGKYFFLMLQIVAIKVDL